MKLQKKSHGRTKKVYLSCCFLCRYTWNKLYKQKVNQKLKELHQELPPDTIATMLDLHPVLRLPFAVSPFAVCVYVHMCCIAFALYSLNLKWIWSLTRLTPWQWKAGKKWFLLSLNSLILLLERSVKAWSPLKINTMVRMIVIMVW